MSTLLRFLSICIAICITLSITACAAPVELSPSAAPIGQVTPVANVDYLVGSVTGLDYGEAVTLRLERLSTDDLYRGYQPQGTELLHFTTGNAENWYQAVPDLLPGPYLLTAEADGYISLKGGIIFQIPEQEAVWQRIDLDFEMVRPEHAPNLVEVPLCAETVEGGGTYRLPKGTATPTPSVFGGESPGWPPGTCYAGHLRSRYFVHDPGMMGQSTGLSPGEKANLFVYILPPKPGENYSHAVPPRNGFIDPPALTPLSIKPTINPEWPRLATVTVTNGNWGIIGHLGGGRKLVFVHAPGWIVEPPAYEVVTFASKLPVLTSGIDFTFQPGGPATPTPSLDIVARDATASAKVFAEITPGPTKTYSPEMQEQERQYYERLSTQTAQALLPPTRTPIRPPFPTSTPIPASVQNPAEVLDIHPSPPASDQVVLARPDGSLVLHSLADGSEQTLLEADLYKLSGEGAFLGPLIWPVRGSPDGRWLLIPTPLDGTWLVSTDGTSKRQINEQRIQVTWAPDSRRVAFTDAGGQQHRANPNAIFVQDIVGGGEPEPLAELPHPVLYPIWSGGCDTKGEGDNADCDEKIATILCEGGYVCSVWLIDVMSGELRELGRFFMPGMGTTPSLISWSSAGDEIWVLDKAFPVDGEKRPLLTTCGHLCGELSPDGKLRAWMEQTHYPDGDYGPRLIIARTDTNASVVYEPQFNQGRPLWTSDSQRLLLKEYTGPRENLWMIDPAVGQAELVAEDVHFLGTLAELQHRSTEVGMQGAIRTLPPPDDLSTWNTYELSELGINVRIPVQWRIEFVDLGYYGRFIIANFDSANGRTAASLASDHLEITLQRISASDSQTDFAVWLSKTKSQESYRMKVEKSTVAGRKAARLVELVSPVREQFRVPLGEYELWIGRQPLDSAQDEIFWQILDSIAWR